MTNIILTMARMCEGVFDWNCVQIPGREKQHNLPQARTEILTQRGARVAHNHQTFPSRSLVVAGRYFDFYYKLPEAKQWLEWAELLMEGALQTSKPMCDCAGYQDITMTHALPCGATGRGILRREAHLQLLRLRFMSHAHGSSRLR